MTAALVSPELLRWARERAGMSVDQLAAKLTIKPEAVMAWEEGQDQPTFRQAERLAAVAHVPFGYLFLPEPPEEELPIPDLRTVRDTPRRRFSLDFMDLLRDVLFKQSWYRDYLREMGAPPKPFVGRFRLGADINIVAQDIRETLGVVSARRQTKNPEEYVSELADAAEAVGVWVMRTGYVGANTHRTFSVQEFRGFAIADDLAPLVLVNGRDAKAAQVFTLAHELAHIWLGQSGISDAGVNETPVGGVEKLCNVIAAEVLVPTVELQEFWTDGVPLEIACADLSRRFKVSRIVIARRALDLALISRAAFNAFYQAELRRWANADGSAGGDYYRSMPIKNGRQFTNAVIRSAMSGQLLLRDAGVLLHMKPVQVVDLYRRRDGAA